MDILVNIDVGDLGRAIAFYEQATGLRLARRLFDGTVAEMAGASAPIYLMSKEAGSCAHAGASEKRHYERHWTPVHLDFVVSDIDAATERAVVAGAKLDGARQTFAWGHQVTMSDPFGNGLCFVEWRGAGYPESESR